MGTHRTAHTGAVGVAVRSRVARRPDLQSVMQRRSAGGAETKLRGLTALSAWPTVLAGTVARVWPADGGRRATDDDEASTRAKET